MNEFECERRLSFSERENDELRIKLIAAEEALRKISNALDYVGEHYPDIHWEAAQHALEDGPGARCPHP